MENINKDTFTFIKQLIANNNRDWFAAHKDEYVTARENVIQFANNLVLSMNKHDHIGDTKVYRIYRDVRFSKDKTPYKDNIGIWYTRATENLRGGYYINIQPGNVFVAGGFWAPNSADLKRIRTEIAINASELRAILNSKSFKNNFGELKGDSLKTAPRGFDKNHPDVDLLRLKQYLVLRKFTDKEALSDTFTKHCDNTFKAMRPLLNHMSEVLTTNENGESIL
ncbi:MAG: DUF2461 domain-containing protein [Saprospiraceae bacterium]